jgi:hypothetical protein
MKNLSFSFAKVIVFLFPILWACSTEEVAPASKNRDANARVGASKEAITITTTATGMLDNNTFVGTVLLEGAINATGTYVMPIVFKGQTFHCLVYITIPGHGTITVRENCSAITMNGVWKVLSGTGHYADLEGGGKLVMPDDITEILTGGVR